MTASSSSTGGIRRALVAAGVVAALVVSVAPAQASPPAIRIQVQGKSTANPVKIDIAATMPDRVSPDGQVRSIRARLEPVGDPTGRQVPNPLVKDYGSGGAREETVTWFPNLAYNGRYAVVVDATGREFQGSDESASARSDFLVEVAALKPTGVSMKGDADERTADVSWDPNPEPDIAGYVVSRAFGDGNYAEIKQVGPDCASRCRFVDDLSGAAGGEYRYTVKAVRPPADPAEWDNDDAWRRTTSPASSSVSVRMRAPAATTTTSTTTRKISSNPGSGSIGGGGSSGSSGSRTPGISRSGTATSGKVDLSGFQASLPRSQRIQRSGGEVDTGFDEQLPFDLGQGEQGGNEPPPDDIAIVEQQRASSVPDSNGPLVFVAAGLLATVLLMHVLWLKGEVERTPLEALAPVSD